MGCQNCENIKLWGQNVLKPNVNKSQLILY